MRLRSSGFEQLMRARWFTRFLSKGKVMRMQRKITQVIALSLVVLTVLSTTPVTAAELTSKNNIGSVSAVGAVQLRGVPINSEGTLFSGDPLNVGASSYAKLVLTEGPKVEVGAGS
jgi:hypothetical protein